ncbi:ATP-grasp domain-containing protein [Methylobacterium sp. ID0610]|uniref:ATP-grasp domain-containing protein n=1 Tax=Methylobacterium carpenticola TaxID=3344827 RepID=UPI0036A9B3CD
MTRPGGAILIAAQSGRALAAAARRAGLRPFVADLFGDADTRALAAGYRQVPGRFGAGPGGRAVLAALDALAAEAGPSLGVVLGSGFEGSPALMRAIAARHRLIGAAPDTVAALKDPPGLAALCTRLAIPHPPLSLDPVPDPENWLLKRRGASGGGHIRPAGPGPVPRGASLQRRMPGRAQSLNFLADGRRILVLADTAQWSAPAPGRPFRYAGAVDPGGMPEGVRAAATAAVAALAEATGLRGLASADLLVDGSDWWFLEINPRPGATLDVLDRRAEPLLLRHIDAAGGRLGPTLALPPDAAATEICYAAEAIAPVPPLAWPDFVMDRPLAGSRIPAGGPICTVRAAGPDAEAARTGVRARTGAVRALFTARETVP